MVTPSYYPVVGGNETAVKSLSDGLVEAGMEVDILTPNMDKRWSPKWKEEIRRDGDTTVIRIPALNIFPPNYNPFFLLLRSNFLPHPGFTRYLKNYDIIHFHDDWDLTFPLFSLFVDRPKVFHYHTISESYDSLRKNPVSRRVLQNIPLHISNSKFASGLLSRMGIPRNKIHILYNAVDTEKFIPGGEKSHSLILFVGRITPSKGLDVLLESLFHVKSDWELAVIGPVYDKEYYSDLRRIAERHNASGKRVNFLGEMPLDALVEWYQKASLFVCPSLSESFGSVNIEALACGTPVVASRVGGIPEAIEDRRNGLLVPPGEPIELAKAIEYLLENKDIKEEYGREGRLMVEDRFSKEKIVNGLLSIYKELTI